MKSSNISALLISLLLAFNAVGQEKLDRDSFVIVKEFVPTLSQASKIRINPEIKDSHHLDLNLNYEFLNKKIEANFSPEPIQAATLKGEPLVRLTRNYLILGYGNNATPMAELYFNQLRSKKISYVFKAKHLSSSGIDNIENSGFSNNDIGLEGNYYTRKQTVNARLNYGYDQVHYYGFNSQIPGLDIENTEKNEDVMQFYNDINVAVGIGNNQRDTVGLRHYSEMSFSNFTERFGASENRFILKEDISLLNKNDVYIFDWALDYNKYRFEQAESGLDSNNENTILYLKPGIELKGAKWNLTGKLHVAADFNRETRLNIYPHAEFRYNLIKSILVPYVGITGDLRRNTFTSFAKENPFINPLIQLKNTDERLSLYAGLGGNLSKNTSFELSVSNTTFEDMALYVKDTTSRDMRTFTLIYDDIELTRLTAEIIYEPLKRWNLALKGDYFIYETQNELEAWHKPDYRISALMGYNLGDKIILKLMVYVIGNQKAKLYEKSEAETLKGTGDINLDFEYRYSKKVGVFLHFNNLASARYEKWQDYPTQRLNLIGGFKFSF